MGSMLRRGVLFSFFLFFYLCAGDGGAPVARALGPARLGDLFPEYEFLSPAAPEDREYLGIAETETFTLRDIPADLIIVEVLNTYCTSCQMQAPIYNEVFRMGETAPATRGRIKWMGVAVGNNETEVESFRKEKAIPFPILPDVNFEFYDALGGPGGIRTPLTLLVRKDEKGRGLVVDSHIGFRRDKGEIFEGIEAALSYDLAYLKIKKGERAVLPVTENLTPPLSDEELRRKIREGMEIARAGLMEIRKTLLKGEELYLGKIRIDSQEKQLFAKVVSRPPVCDVCHDIHFIYVFDEEGTVVNFIPIELTKYGNRPWNEKDIEKTKNRLIGRSLLDPFQFDRDVDAVTQATITSVVIFDSMNKGKRIYTDLMREDYVKE